MFSGSPEVFPLCGAGRSILGVGRRLSLVVRRSPLPMPRGRYPIGLSGDVMHRTVIGIAGRQPRELTHC